MPIRWSFCVKDLPLWRSFTDLSIFIIIADLLKWSIATIEQICRCLEKPWSICQASGYLQKLCWSVNLSIFRKDHTDLSILPNLYITLINWQRLCRSFEIIWHICRCPAITEQLCRFLERSWFVIDLSGSRLFAKIVLTSLS